MRVLPILFNGDMVRAILDGRKTVTRRAIKPQPKMILSFNLAGYGHEKWSYPPPKAHELWGEKYKCPDNITKEDKSMLWTPPCNTDDILYVRETWDNLPVNPDGSYCGYDRYYYRADGDLRPEGWQGNWHPSVHMLKYAARIWLKVTDVRVERLEDITDEQAKADGANWKNGKNVGWEEKMRRTAIDRFAELWNSTIKKSDLELYGWDANPWVWVIEFERCEKPEEV